MKDALAQTRARSPQVDEAKKSVRRLRRASRAKDGLGQLPDASSARSAAAFVTPQGVALAVGDQLQEVFMKAQA